MARVIGDARGPLPAVLRPLTVPASWAYGAGVRIHRALESMRTPRDAGVPVISVGNVAAGGTGKTPFVRWTVGALEESGRIPAIAMRGYGARRGLSDEAEEYRAMLPGTPLAVGGDRAAAIARTRARHPEVDAVVLDDGFQHRALERALDIVLVDATRPAIDGALLPAGWLREPAEALRRAGVVVITRAEREDERIADLVRRVRGRGPDAWTRHAWDVVDRFVGADPRPGIASDLAGMRVVVACAIGNPQAFARDVRTHGAEVSAERFARDHHAYSDAEVDAIAADASGLPVVVTGKDWAKIGPAVARSLGAAARCEWLIPRVGIEFVAGEGDVRSAVARALATCA
jgi:tetraacyldisaccharide 4'-kinase